MTKQELATRIWSMANKMRTKIKANEYKDYIIGFMFYKFLSEKELDFLKSQGITTGELKEMDEDDMTFIRESLGYAISYDNLFSSWKSKGISLDAKIVSEGIDSFNKNVNPAQKTVFAQIFNTLQSGISKLGDSSGSRDRAVRDIVDMVNNIREERNSGYDILGYVYEYLIYKFATAAKDDGAFYTPHEVSKLMAMIIADECKEKKELQVYDPTSGSGSLLRTIGEEASRYIPEKDITYYGQEKITETYHLTRMNLIMKGVPSQNIIVRNGDTLEDDWPYFDENTAYKPLSVNAVVSNPPYSLNWEPDGRENDERFRKYGLAPSGKADYAFLLHCLYHLQNDGIMAIVLPHGVLFRGDTEGEIRKNLCLEHNIETVIGLPANLFYATSIPTIIMILRKNRKADDILFIDASQGYEKVGKQNALRECDIKRIYDAVKGRRDVESFAKLVSLDIIKDNDYNLNIPRYVSACNDQESIDFAALMNGTVLNTELDEYMDFWDAFPSLRTQLFEDKGDGYSIFKDVIIKDTVTNNADVKSYTAVFDKKVSELRMDLVKTLVRDKYDISRTDIMVIHDQITEKIFEMVKDISIIDKYDAYQFFMDSWSVITADLDIITNSGGSLDIARSVEPNMVIKKIKKEDVEVQEGYKGTIIDFDLVGEMYFKHEYGKVKIIEDQIASLESERDEIFESLEEDMRNKVGNGERFTEKELKAYLKNDNNDELIRALNAISQINDLNKELNGKKGKNGTKGLKDAIIDKIQNKIQSLTDDEIKELLVQKWISPICIRMSGMINNAVSDLIKSLTDINNKYGKPLSCIDDSIEALNDELINILSDLTGTDTDNAAIETLKEVLGYVKEA